VRIEIVESDPVVFPLSQDSVPAQPSLGSLQDQKLEQRAIIMQRHTPFAIVIFDRKLIGSPRTTNPLGAAFCGGIQVLSCRHNPTLLRTGRAENKKLQTRHCYGCAEAECESPMSIEVRAFRSLSS